MQPARFVAFPDGNAATVATLEHVRSQAVESATGFPVILDVIPESQGQESDVVNTKFVNQLSHFLLEDKPCPLVTGGENSRASVNYTY
jgi:hypothetical protein